jgi:hypothetical protein
MEGSTVHGWATPHGSAAPDELVLASVPLITTIVADLVDRLGEPTDTAHLTSVALVAALDAATSYEPDQDGPFPRYVSALVRNALLGEVRSGLLSPAHEDRVPADPVEDDEAIVALCRDLHDLSEREMELVDSIVDDREPTALVRLIQVRTEALMLVQRAMRAREAEPTGSPEQAAARGSAFAAVLAGRPQTPRPAPSRWRLRRQA